MELGAQPSPVDTVESALCEDLASGDAEIATIAPVLRHLVASDGSSIFTDVVIAGVRGMAGDLARQLMDALNRADGSIDPVDHDPAELSELTAAIVASPALLGHLHALAIEWQLTQRLQARLAVDPVLSPLLQAQMASADPAISALAMKLLAAQARFCQSQRRMTLALGELPGDLLHGVLQAMRTLAGEDEGARAQAAEAAIRAGIDESQSRLRLIAALVASMGGSAVTALAVSHAGAAIFLTALALASGQDRDFASVATSESQLARLALSLRAAGLKPAAVQEQFLALHPEVELPEGFEMLSPDHAAAILANASSPGGSGP